MNKSLIIALAAFVVVAGVAAGIYYSKGGFSPDSDTAGIPRADVTVPLTGAGTEGDVTAVEPKASAEITEELCLTITAYVSIGTQALIDRDSVKAGKAEKEIRALETQYGVDAASDEFGDACNNMVAFKDDYVDKLTAKIAELDSLLSR